MNKGGIDITVLCHKHSKQPLLQTRGSWCSSRGAYDWRVPPMRHRAIVLTYTTDRPPAGLCSGLTAATSIVSNRIR